MNWVRLKNTTPVEADLIQGILEGHGIPAIIKQESLGRIYGLTVGQWGETLVLVPETVLEEAREILKELKDDH